MYIKSAFRWMIINPGDSDLFLSLREIIILINACIWAVTFHVIYLKFSIFLNWVLQRKVGVGTVFHYLDDFVVLGSSGSDECSC